MAVALGVNGGILGPANTPSLSSASGLWTWAEQYRAQRGGSWPPFVTPDPYFDYVTLLLHGNGTNGAQNNTFLDSSSNNFTITRNGNTTQGTFTPYGANWSNYFSGGANQLSVAAASAIDLASSDFTIECWVFPGTRTNVIDSVFGYGPYTTMLYRNDTTWSWEVGNGSSANYFTITATCTPNTWQHIALTRSGNTFTFWLNGVSAGTNSTANAVGTASKNLSVGFNGTTPPTQYFTGYISNFRIVKGTAVYTSAFTPPAAPLTAITNTSLLTCQSNRFIDNSSNNFTITLVGSPSVQRFSPFNPPAAYSAATIGGSGYFDGSGDYLAGPSNAAFAFGTGDFTIEAWVNSTNYSGTNAIFETRSAGNESTGVILYIRADGKPEMYRSAAVITGSTALSQNTWNHVALTRSGSTCTLWLNGVSIGTATDATNLTQQNSFVGAAYTGVNNLMVGYISNLRVVKGTAVYTGAFTPPSAPLTAITNTSLLLNFTNGGIFDNAMMNDLETVGNAQISTSVSKFGGGSMYFDGSGDYLLPSSAGTNNPLALGSGDFTLEFWLNFAALGDVTVIDWRPTSTNGAYPTLYMDVGTNKIVYYANSANRITSSTVFTTSTWYHIALVRSSGSTKLYINGTNEGATYTDSTNYLAAAVRPIIGANGAGGGTNAINAYIDDLRITKGYARYTANFSVPTAPFPDQ